MQSTDNDLEIINLEETFKDECKCQSEHAETKCTVTVTHYASTTCGSYPPLMVCQSSAEWLAAHMADPNGYCAGCRRPASECWTVRPI